jgi:DNA-binding GntR family transcriptional regulator
VTNAPLPPPAAAPRRSSSGNQAADYIRRLIFDGELKPGERVPQDDIAEALSFSRIPVREGLIALEREGWVTIELNRGAFVNTLDADAVRDSYELFGLVYGLAAKRALARSEPGVIDKLVHIEKQLRATDDPDEVAHLTYVFHNTIVEAARSPRIKVVLRASRGLVAGNFFEEVEGSINVEQKGTAAVVRALRKGDGDKAAAEYLSMMRRQGELVVKTFEARGLFSPR